MEGSAAEPLLPSSQETLGEDGAEDSADVLPPWIRAAGALAGAVSAGMSTAVEVGDAVKKKLAAGKIKVLARAYVSVSESGVISKESALLLIEMWNTLDPNWFRSDLLLLPKVTDRFNDFLDRQRSVLLKKFWILDKMLGSWVCPQIKFQSEALERVLCDLSPPEDRRVYFGRELLVTQLAGADTWCGCLLSKLLPCFGPVDIGKLLSKLLPIGDGGETRKRFLVRALKNDLDKRRHRNEATSENMGSMVHRLWSEPLPSANASVRYQLAKLYMIIIITRYIPVMTRSLVFVKITSFMLWVVTSWDSEYWKTDVVCHILWIAVLVFLVDFLSHYRRVMSPRVPFLAADLHLTLEKKGLIQKVDYVLWRDVYLREKEKNDEPDGGT